ncbi:MAG: ceramidase domain-containing protein, partial [Pseudomonadota bacterium]|nr:ceramidase domain-containing protein [Pseudomonadota bacterium]
MAVQAKRKPRSRQKFELKREEILAAATDFINVQGVKGTTLGEVAKMVDLNTTSITYYFKRKELLAAAVFERSMERLHDMVRASGAQPDPRSRVRHFVDQHVALRADVIRGRGKALASLSDLRTLEDNIRLPLERRFQEIFRDVRAFFETPAEPASKTVMTGRAHMLLETIFWLPVWISHYPLDEFDRVSRRLFDILDHGIARSDAIWAPVLLTGPVLGGLVGALLSVTTFLYLNHDRDNKEWIVATQSASGYWPAPTADFDWCELNYVYTPYIAELWNSVTSLLFLVGPVLLWGSS